MDKIGVCGDNCGLCPRYIASGRIDLERLKEVAVLWKKAGFRDKIVSPEDLACFGCSPKNNCAYHRQMDCATGKKFHNCGECADYPCGVVLEGFEKTRAHKEKCRKNCSAGDYSVLDKAFFRKKEYLDMIHNKKFKK
jgi:hypothetical protein